MSVSVYGSHVLLLRCAVLIVRKLNNNVALAREDSGKELVVFGKGIGYPKTPYTLYNETRISKRFYGVSDKVLSIVASLSDDALLAATEIADLAHNELGCSLNPNLAFTLADHIQFAISRTAEGISIENPLASEIAAVYPRETAIGHRGVKIARRCCKAPIPGIEAYAIAMHLVNGEMQNAGSMGDMSLVMESTELIERLMVIVEQALGQRTDRFSYAYMSFATHLRYLIGRLMRSTEGRQQAGAEDELLEQVGKDFPLAYECASDINDYLARERGWQCTPEELLYLTMHVNRFARAQ